MNRGTHLVPYPADLSEICGVSRSAQPLLFLVVMNFARGIALASLALGSLLSVGCGANYNDRAESKLAEVRAKAWDDVISPTCAVRSPGGVEGKGCGLFLERASQEDYRVRFRDRGCQQKTEAECQELFQRMIDAVLAQRYHHADFDGVKRICDENPKRCTGPYAYELRLLESHNEHVQTELTSAEAAIEAERSAAADRATADGLLFFGLLVADLFLPTRSSPKCRTYPSVAGGHTRAVVVVH